MTSGATYIHGTDASEQERLALLNRLTNPPFLDFLRLEGGECVLEVGSGLGILTREAAARLPRGTITGLENSPDQLAAARRDLPANVRFVEGDAHDLPFGEGEFDVVYCRYVLEHVVDPANVLREMRRVLRPGGRVFVQENDILVMELFPECPRFAQMWRRFAELQRRLGGDARIGRRLFALLREAGFRQIELGLQPEVHWSGLPTFRPCVENTIGNIRSGTAAFQAMGLATAEEIHAAVAELEAFRERDDAVTWFCWHRARGVR